MNTCAYTCSITKVQVQVQVQQYTTNTSKYFGKPQRRSKHYWSVLHYNCCFLGPINRTPLQRKSATININTVNTINALLVIYPYGSRRPLLLPTRLTKGVSKRAPPHSWRTYLPQATTLVLATLSPDPFANAKSTKKKQDSNRPAPKTRVQD